MFEFIIPKIPHIHVEYGEFKAAVEIPTGILLAGSLPKEKIKLILAWIEIHNDELLANWKLATEGVSPFKIEGLK